MIRSLIEQIDKSIRTQRERIADAEREIARLERLKDKYEPHLNTLRGACDGRVA